MIGMNAQNGRALSGIDHVRQSVTDILTTPVGTRVMRRDYGSKLFELVDAPMNADTLLQMYAATAEAIERWEPRLKYESARAKSAEPGRVEMSVTGIYLPNGQRVTLDGIVVK